MLSIDRNRVKSGADEKESTKRKIKCSGKLYLSESEELVQTIQPNSAFALELPLLVSLAFQAYDL